MRSCGVWIGSILCVLLCACAANPPRPSQASLVPPQPRDCDKLFPHPDVPPLDVAAGILPADLAEAGAWRLMLSRFHKCRQDNLSDRDRYLQSQGDALQAEERQLQEDMTAYQQRIAAAQAESDEYNAACQVQGLDPAHYQSCVQRQQQVNQDIAQVNDAYRGLERRQADQSQRIAAFDGEVTAIPESIQTAYQDYQAAVREQGHWLDMARGLIALPVNLGTVKPAACPSVQQPPKDLPEMDAMSEGLVACLRRMPAGLLLPPPQAPHADPVTSR